MLSSQSPSGRVLHGRQVAEVKLGRDRFALSMPRQCFPEVRRRPIRPALISGFCSMKRLGVFLLPLDGMLVHRRVTPSIKFTGTHLYTWVERGTVRVKCLAQEHNTMSSLHPTQYYRSTTQYYRNTTQCD